MLDLFVSAAMSVQEFDLLTPSKNKRNQNLVAAIPAHVIPLIPVHNLRRLRTEFFQSMTIEQVRTVKNRVVKKYIYLNIFWKINTFMNTTDSLENRYFHWKKCINPILTTT